MSSDSRGQELSSFYATEHDGLWAGYRDRDRGPRPRNSGYESPRSQIEVRKAH